MAIDIPIHRLAMFFMIMFTRIKVIPNQGEIVVAYLDDSDVTKIKELRTAYKKDYTAKDVHSISKIEAVYMG